MISEFEYVDLVFENCNYVRILPEYVRFLNLVEITTDIWTNIVQQYIEVKNCKKFEMILDLKALVFKTYFENKFDTTETFEQHLNTFKDITCVNIKTSKGEEFCIGVPWKSYTYDETSNALQKVEFEKNTFTIKCEFDKG